RRPLPRRQAVRAAAAPQLDPHDARPRGDRTTLVAHSAPFPHPPGPANAAGHGSVLGKRVIRIAIQPAIARLGGGDDRMSTRFRMRGRVLVRRGVAAQRDAALLAGAQLDPAGADLHALRALAALGLFDALDRFDMIADGSRTHGCVTPTLHDTCSVLG